MKRVLQCVAVCCSMLQYVLVCCSLLQCVIAPKEVYETCVAVCCGLLQYVKVYFSTLQRSSGLALVQNEVCQLFDAACSNVLHCVAVCSRRFWIALLCK